MKFSKMKNQMRMLSPASIKPLKLAQNNHEISFTPLDSNNFNFQKFSLLEDSLKMLTKSHKNSLITAYKYPKYIPKIPIRNNHDKLDIKKVFLNQRKNSVKIHNFEINSTQRRKNINA